MRNLKRLVCVALPLLLLSLAISSTQGSSEEAVKKEVVLDETFSEFGEGTLEASDYEGEEEEIIPGDYLSSQGNYGGSAPPPPLTYPELSPQIPFESVYSPPPQSAYLAPLVASHKVDINLPTYAAPAPIPLPPPIPVPSYNYSPVVSYPPPPPIPIPEPNYLPVVSYPPPPPPPIPIPELNYNYSSPAISYPQPLPSPIPIPVPSYNYSSPVISYPQPLPPPIPIPVPSYNYSPPIPVPVPIPIAVSNYTYSKPAIIQRPIVANNYSLITQQRPIIASSQSSVYRYSIAELAPFIPLAGYRANHWSLFYYRASPYRSCPKNVYLNSPNYRDIEAAFQYALQQLKTTLSTNIQYLNATQPSFAARHQVFSFLTQQNARMDEEGLLIELVSQYLADRACLTNGTSNVICHV